MNLLNHYLIFVKTHCPILICPAANQQEERLQGKHFPVSRYLHEKKYMLYMAKKRRTKGKQNTKQLRNYCPSWDKVIYANCGLKNIA